MEGEAPHTGTTIVAVTYPGGVVIGADSRVSTGNYVSNRASNKIAQLSDTVYLLRSGSAADTQAVGDYGARVWGEGGERSSARGRGRREGRSERTGDRDARSGGESDVDRMSF